MDNSSLKQWFNSLNDLPVDNSLFFIQDINRIVNGSGLTPENFANLDFYYVYSAFNGLGLALNPSDFKNQDLYKIYSKFEYLTDVYTAADFNNQDYWQIYMSIPIFAPEPETVAFFSSTTIQNNDTLYYGGTAQEITGNGMWIAVNNFVVSTKNAGIFSKLRYFYPFVGGTALDTSVNLIDPALYQLTYLGGLTFGAQGVTPDGISGVATTGFNLLTELTGTNYFQGCYIGNNPTISGQAMGARLISSPNPQNQMFPRIISINRNQIGLSVILSKTNGGGSAFDSLGHYYMERTSASDQLNYKRNVLLQNNTTSTFLSHPNNEMGLFAQTYGAAGASPYLNYSTHIQSANYLGEGTLTPLQRNTLHNAIVTLQTELFRNV